MFKALQLITHEVFGDNDWTLVYCVVVYFWKHKSKRQLFYEMGIVDSSDITSIG